MELSNRISLNFPSSTRLIYIIPRHARSAVGTRPRNGNRYVHLYPSSLIHFPSLLKSFPSLPTDRTRGRAECKVHYKAKCNSAQESDAVAIKKCRRMSGKWGFLRERDIEVAASKRRMRFAVAKFCNAKRTRDKTSRL